MVHPTISEKGKAELLAAFDRVMRAGPVASGKAFVRIALVGQRESKLNAPISPTASQLRRLRKTRRKVTRNARATSRPSPGGLVQSIDQKSDATQAVIFVAANSHAGKYAGRIHDDKGKTWRNRGPGTIAKGARADEKFISRAVVDGTGNFTKILDSEFDKANKAAFGG